MRLWPEDSLLAVILGFTLWFSLISLEFILVYASITQQIIIAQLFAHVIIIFALCAVYFKQVKEHHHFILESIYLGVIWLIINIVLDLFVLVPLQDLNIIQFIFTSGWEYLTLPIQTLIFGVFIHYTALQDYF